MLVSELFHVLITPAGSRMFAASEFIQLDRLLILASRFVNPLVMLAITFTGNDWESSPISTLLTYTLAILPYFPGMFITRAS